jgi:hypothetical protein
MGQLLYVLPLGHKLKYGATRTGRPYWTVVRSNTVRMLCEFLATCFLRRYLEKNQS